MTIHFHSTLIKIYIYYFPQELKHITWIIVAINIARVKPAIAKSGAA
jgi:hypothetical protein